MLAATHPMVVMAMPSRWLMAPVTLLRRKNR